jgi:cytochrome oxidase Cu insertion factor (SCO1/SenC/PrrC family)
MKTLRQSAILAYVAQALLRAVSRLFSTPSSRLGVARSGDAARTSACATLILLMAGTAFAGFDRISGPQPGQAVGVLPPGVTPPQLEGVGVDEHLGRAVDLKLQFTDESGYQVPLESFFHKDRPVILDLVYYTCPMLCNLILNGQVDAMKELTWTPGTNYEVVTISFDPQDTFDLARKKKETYLDAYGRPAPGWHFLADYHGNAKKLAEEIGISLSLRCQAAAVRAHLGHHGADAGGQTGAVSVWHPVPLARLALRADGGRRGPQHRHHRQDSAVVLSLRSDGQRVRVVRVERDAGGRSFNGTHNGIFPVALIPRGAPPRRRASGKDGIETNDGMAY